MCAGKMRSLYGAPSGLACSPKLHGEQWISLGKLTAQGPKTSRRHEPTAAHYHGIVNQRCVGYRVDYER
jgi:hypothetical protein